ncbi:hypothetical protein B0H12DRAFT_1150850, partial [Mycena haematopus]
ILTPNTTTRSFLARAHHAHCRSSLCLTQWIHALPLATTIGRTRDACREQSNPLQIVSLGPHDSSSVRPFILGATNIKC